MSFPSFPNKNWSEEGDPMKRTWTIIGVGDVAGSFHGTRRCSVSRLPLLLMITLGKSSIPMELFCSASTRGAPTSTPP
jgi:hypothetical protein